MNRRILRCARAVALSRRGDADRLRDRTPSESVSAKAAAVLKASFKRAGPGEARSPRPGRDAEGLQPLRRQGAAEGRRRARSRKRNLATINGRPTASTWATGRTARRSRRAARHAVLRRSEGRPPAPTATPATSSRRRSSPTARSGPACTSSARCRGYDRRDRSKYAYGKIYNAEAYSACSNMPRFGHNGILTEQQIKDVVALLLDPDSPVNK